MSDDTTKVDTPTNAAPSADKAPENAAVTGSAALPQDELNRLTDDIIAGLRPSTTRKSRPTSTNSA